MLKVCTVDRRGGRDGEVDGRSLGKIQEKKRRKGGTLKGYKGQQDSKNLGRIAGSSGTV